MDTFVNPLRNSMRNVSNAVKSLPDSLAESVNKMSDNMGKMSERLGQDIKQSFFKVQISMYFCVCISFKSSVHVRFVFPRNYVLTTPCKMWIQFKSSTLNIGTIHCKHLTLIIFRGVHILLDIFPSLSKTNEEKSFGYTLLKSQLDVRNARLHYV